MLNEGELDEGKIRYEIGNDLYEYIKGYEEKLTYINKAEIIMILDELSANLGKFSVKINLFEMKKKEKYISVYGRNSNDLKGSNRMSKEFKKQPVSLLSKIFVSSHDYIATKISTKIIPVNLAFYPHPKENDVPTIHLRYIKILQNFNNKTAKKR